MEPQLVDPTSFSLSLYRLSCSGSAAEMVNPLLVSFAYTDCANDGITSRRTPDFEAVYTSPDKVTQAVTQSLAPPISPCRPTFRPPEGYKT